MMQLFSTEESMPNLDPATSTSSKKEATKKREVTPPAKQVAFVPQGSTPIAVLQQAMADPRTIRPADILALQRRYGNQAVQRLLATRTIQAKLTVGAANDTYEQEADRVAAQVMAAPASTPDVQHLEEEEEIQAKPLAPTITPLMQRESVLEEEELQAQFVQREAAPEEEELQARFVQRAVEEEELQAKALVQRSGGGFEAGADFETQLSTARGSGAPLPDPTREFMEQRIGADFSGVKVHTDSQSDQLNQAVQAKAFTTGQDVFFRQGAYEPGSRDGQELIAHELTHVVQQNERVERSFDPLVPAKATMIQGNAHEIGCNCGKCPTHVQLVLNNQIQRRVHHEEGRRTIGVSPPNVIQRRPADYLRGFREGYRIGYEEGLREGLGELINDRVIDRGVAQQIVRQEVGDDGLSIQIPGIQSNPVYLADFDPGETDEDHYQAGFNSGKGPGIDEGYEKALRDYGYSRKYQQIPPGNMQIARQDNNGQCVYCNAQPIADVDHVEPLKRHWNSRGSMMDVGARSNEVNDIRNLVGSCAACNRSKGAKQLGPGWWPSSWPNNTWWPHGPQRARQHNNPPPYW
jgi:5-methylcytosine-specific restriction endonuclease McrA